jgi:hypothetical protein
MVVNFRTRGISQDEYKLTRTPVLIKKKKKREWTVLTYHLENIDFCEP